MTKVSQSIVYTIIFILNLAALSLSAQAAMIGTEAVLAAQNRQVTEDKVKLALARDDVSSQLQKMGVNPDDARQRVAALNDQELENLSHRLDRLPAGGDFFGTVGLIFIILIITDLLGFTKIFPFTRAQR
jgi:hypothetical protein